MDVCRFLIERCVFPGLLLISFFSACSSSQKNRSRDHAFIAYWPPPENSSGLRLAVKDLIDVKGAVTTAGSEYLARTSPPASQDAKCLELARERNVQIVGKTNLTELAVTVSGKNRYFGTPRNPARSTRPRSVPDASNSRRDRATPARGPRH